MRWLWWVFLFGCSAHPVSPIAQADFQSRYDQASCDFLVRCGYYGDEAACQMEGTASSYGAISAAYAPAVTAGLATYDANAAGECVAAIESESCSAGSSPAACEQVFAGKLLNGTPCESSTECASGWCTGGQLQNGCRVGGSCTPAPGPGTSCSATFVCDSSAYCDGTTCQPLVARGGACAQGVVCQPGLACVTSNGAASGTCEPEAGEGESCATVPCRDIGDYCSSTKICKRGARVGQPCDPVPNSCVSEATCGPSGTCEALPVLGQPCVSRCAGAAFCAEDSSGQPTVCTSAQPSGSPCGAPNQCASGYCDFSSGSIGTCRDVPVCL